MKYKKKGNFIIFSVSAGLALIFCIISLPRLYQDSSDLGSETFIEQLEVFRNLTSDDFRFLYSYKHLLILVNPIPAKGTILLATKDENFASKNPRFQVFKMEEAASGDYIKIFANDGLRAIHGLNIQTTKLRNLELQIIDNGVDFKRKWRNSRFISCLGLNVSNAQRVIPESYVNDLVNFRNFIEQYHSSIFFFGGTLLGWYRECSFIRDTTDVDFAMKIEELEESMLVDLKETTLFDLFWMLGKKEDSLELSVYSHGIKIDLFFLYRDATNDWVGGMFIPERRKLRWVYPHIGQLCTGDLLGKLFNVPCNVESVLQADYGPNWRIPHTTATFQWDKSHKNVRRVGFWKKSEWKDVYRTFDPHSKNQNSFSTLSTEARKSTIRQ